MFLWFSLEKYDIKNNEEKTKDKEVKDKPVGFRFAKDAMAMLIEKPAPKNKYGLLNLIINALFLIESFNIIKQQMITYKQIFI